MMEIFICAVIRYAREREVSKRVLWNPDLEMQWRKKKSFFKKQVAPKDSFPFEKTSNH